jgi:hypothetical protein
MKTTPSSTPIPFPVRTLLLLALPTALHADTTIDPSPANSHAYGANIGWMNCRGDVTNGAVIGEFTCSGFLYSANCGWIHLGSGSPANGIRYQNNSATDFGVNTQDYSSNGVTWEAKLRGFAYGANIGWVNFEATGDPRINLATGQLLGRAYGANVGWISLSETGVTVLTTTIRPGLDTDADGLPDGWEKTYTPLLSTMNAVTDTDKDGSSDRTEYGNDTSPTNPNDNLDITAFTGTRAVSPFLTDITWTSKPTRRYAIQSNAGLTNPWLTAADNILPGAGTTTFKSFPSASQPNRTFFRVIPKLPLAP